MAANHKDLGSGLFFIAFGLGAFAINRGYRFGDPGDIGPGLFPTSLAVILVVIGLAVVGKSFFSTPEHLTSVEWRAVVATIGAIVAFGLALDPLGLVPAVVLLCVISQLGSRDVRLVSAAVITVVLAVGATLIFHYGLGLRLQPFGSWFR